MDASDLVAFAALAGMPAVSGCVHEHHPIDFPPPPWLERAVLTQGLSAAPGAERSPDAARDADALRADAPQVDERERAVANDRGRRERAHQREAVALAAGECAGDGRRERGEVARGALEMAGVDDQVVDVL